MTTLPVQKLMPISEDGVAHVPLGEGYAGRTLLVEEKEPGVWVLRAVTVIPDNERWLHTPEMQARLKEAFAWAEKNPARATTPAEFEELRRQLDALP